MSLHPYQILVKPLLTEKATNGQHVERPQYTFEVYRDANKVEIRKAVEKAFPDVTVVSVNTIMMKGKKKRLRSAKLGKCRNWKKAIITLKEGQSINLV
jgi:large subunit ribosomal protein L23